MSCSPLLSPTVRRWHAQHRRHALVPGTEAAALQLNRFSYRNEQGIAGKLDHRIRADPDILMPQWSLLSSTDGVLWRTFRLHAIIKHIGPTTVSGHYRAALQPYQDDSPDSMTLCGHTEDGQSATQILPSLIEDTNYILVYRLRSAATS